ncbi:unnamed protein product [Phytophthora lilii]|uniref:Unnamed protein product n=1 Tax=Phytophthora lilii TaxID=2077276 RepID=A0A9W6U067_9STRA|nr:unnamed protein product [Phytophthora lilii]
MGINASKSTAEEPQVPSHWNAAQIPPQHGKVAIVTGANSGIGYEMALELARKGAHVVLGCRNQERGLKAQAVIIEQIATAADPGTVKFMQIDMGNLGSVRDFCEEFKKTHDRLDILINNAGIGGGTYTETVDGYELVFATNYLGHFALTAQLFNLLKKSVSSRIVSVSSFLHWYGARVFNEDNIMAKDSKEHGQLGTYSVSKLCLLLFTIELDRRLKAAGIENVTAAAAHPGYCDTKIMKKSAAKNSSWFWWLMFESASLFPPQGAPKGALPALYAATTDGVNGGDYYGPKYLEVYGYPVREDSSSLSRSEKAAAKLWAYSEELTHLNFTIENKFVNVYLSTSIRAQSALAMENLHHRKISVNMRFLAIPWNPLRIQSAYEDGNRWHCGVYEAGCRVGTPSSVQSFSEEFKKRHDRLDLLINNAGVVGGDYALSADGYELLFATNHLGHFALTAQLFGLLKKSTSSRVVNVSSQAHRQIQVFDEDEIMLTSEEQYSPMQSYGRTKVYNIMFAKELERRIQAGGVDGVTAVACRPGLSVSGLTTKTASASSSWLWWLFYKLATYAPSQSSKMGVLPTLYTATGDGVEGGDFFLGLSTSDSSDNQFAR